MTVIPLLGEGGTVIPAAPTSPGELVVEDNQYQLRDLLIGVGSVFRWKDRPPSLWGTDSLRTADIARDATHGVDGGRDLLDTKTVSGELWLLTEGADLLAAVDLLSGAWAPSDVNIPFVAQLHGQKRRRYGRPRRWSLNPDRVATTGHPVAVVQFEALDPLVYSDELHQQVTGPVTSSGGFTPPFVVPFTVGTVSSTGTVTVNNIGNASAPWQARLDGPLTDPQIRHVEQNRMLTFDANGGLTIAAGQWVDIISDGRQVLLNGTADVRTRLRVPDSRWWSLDPGSQQIELTADAGTGTMTFTWRDSWWS